MEPTTKAIIEQMMAELTKGVGASALCSVTSEQIREAILQTVDGALDEWQSAGLRDGLLAVFQPFERDKAEGRQANEER